MTDIQRHVDMLEGELLKLASGATNPGEKLRAYLEANLSGFSPEDRLSILESLEGSFAAEAQRGAGACAAKGGDEASRLMSRFLGRDFVAEGVSQEEIYNKFAVSLNTLFDSLNRIMAVINQTLLGEQPELSTIRKIIGSNMDGEGNDELISNYLERIQRSFLIAHTAFQEASSALLGQILGELDPDKFAKSLSSGLKFGALRKAELYDMYDERYAKMKRWHESGQYLERLLRDFEKRCQQQI